MKNMQNTFFEFQKYLSNQKSNDSIQLLDYINIDQQMKESYHKFLNFNDSSNKNTENKNILNQIDLFNKNKKLDQRMKSNDNSENYNLTNENIILNEYNLNSDNNK